MVTHMLKCVCQEDLWPAFHACSSTIAHRSCRALKIVPGTPYKCSIMRFSTDHDLSPSCFNVWRRLVTLVGLGMCRQLAPGLACAYICFAQTGRSSQLHVENLMACGSRRPQSSLRRTIQT
jgi:hypothetical protein